MAALFVLYSLLAFVAIVTTQASDVQLHYVSGTGRVICASDNKPTHSVFWDRIAQDVAASAAKGPTISAGLYAVMHSAIFDAWSVTHNRRPQSYQRYGSRSDDDSCTLKKLAMSHAAYYTIASIIPEGESLAAQAFNESHAGCKHSYYFSTSNEIGLRSAKKIIAEYEREVLPANQPQFIHSSPIERWAPERVPIDSSTGPFQEYLTPDWGRRYTFGIHNGSSVGVKDPEPALLVSGTLDVNTSTVTLEDGEVIGITSDLVGPVINPEFVRQAERVVQASANITETQKFIAEFWEFGGKTSFPPGAWMTIAQFVSFRDGNTDDEDVGLFYAMGNAMNDAGVSTWYLKLFYNYARPVRAIRDLGRLGLIGIQNWYSVLRGGVIRAPVTEFTTYQMPDSDPSPPFPEYTSGHSTFSSSGAEVLRKWTGSDNFGGNVTLYSRESRFELNAFPTHPVTLIWNTFTEAANEAGASRIYGGIHFDDGNIEGLISGKVIGESAYLKAYELWKAHNNTPE